MGAGRANAVEPGGARAAPFGHSVARVPVDLRCVRSGAPRRVDAHRADEVRTATAGSGGGVADPAAARVLGSFGALRDTGSVTPLSSTTKGGVAGARVPGVAPGVADLGRHLAIGRQIGERAGKWCGLFLKGDREWGGSGRPGGSGGPSDSGSRGAPDRSEGKTDEKG